MDQIVDWLSLFAQAHTQLVSFVTSLVPVLVAAGGIYSIFLTWRNLREIFDMLSDHYDVDGDHEDHGEFVLSDDGMSISGWQSDSGAYYPYYHDEDFNDGVDPESGESIYGLEDDPDNEAASYDC